MNCEVAIYKGEPTIFVMLNMKEAEIELSNLALRIRAGRNLELKNYLKRYQMNLLSELMKSQVINKIDNVVILHENYNYIHCSILSEDEDFLNIRLTKTLNTTVGKHNKNSDFQILKKHIKQIDIKGKGYDSVQN